MGLMNGLTSLVNSSANAKNNRELHDYLATAADKVSAALMMVDSDFMVTYVNEPTMELMRANAAAFQKLWPTFSSDAIVGTCIDTFHKNPAHQRRMLADASRLPMETEITVGDRWIKLLVNGNFDKKGKLSGYMLEWRDVTDDRVNAGRLKALDRVQATIEFTLDGKITDANENFLKTIGYSLDEIKGQHHSMFVEPAYRASPEYRQFWNKLQSGDFDAGQYKRNGKGGREIWLEASYNPLFDSKGKPFKVMKLATEVTESRLKNADFEGQINAISKAQAVIEFTTDGKILTANDNFTKAMGYSLEEIKGQHHSMFVEPHERSSGNYQLFWDKLKRGEFDSGRYKRIARGGREVWLQASYNAIFDLNGRPFKVVKYASDITAQIKAEELLKQAVQETRDVVAAAEGNDLSQRIPMDGKTGEIQLLCSGVNGLLDTMTGVVKDISVSAREVANASGEVATATTDLSQRTEEQAASLEETSAAMDEISAAVKKNAENARHASESAVATQQVANKGGEVVSHAVEAMARIEDSSRKIADIIGVIDEIARQTNLLALNAAVEAARAGDAGRGFAVVASEVRNLAQRSSQAAKDIKDLINNSTSQVRDGVSLVNEAGGQLKAIVDAIKQVAAIMSEIAHASNEQSTGVDEVNKALTQMDEVTQQNSALVEENAATAKTLEQHAASMSEKVSAFRLGDEMEHAAEPMRMAAGGGGGRMMAPRPAPRPAAAAPRSAGAAGNRRGPVGTMQTALAQAVSNDDWKEF